MIPCFYFFVVSARMDYNRFRFAKPQRHEAYEKENQYSVAAVGSAPISRSSSVNKDRNLLWYKLPPPMLIQIGLLSSHVFATSLDSWQNTAATTNCTDFGSYSDLDNDHWSMKQSPGSLFLQKQQKQRKQPGQLSQYSEQTTGWPTEELWFDSRKS